MSKVRGFVDMSIVGVITVAFADAVFVVVMF